MLLPNPPVEAGRVEDVLRVTLKARHLHFFGELVEADWARGLVLVHHWVVVLSSERLGNLSNLIVEGSLTRLKGPPFGEGVRNYVGVRKSVADLDVAHVQVAKHNVAE